MTRQLFGGMFAAAMFVVAGWAADAAAADATGSWELLTVTDDGQEIPSVVIIEKDGDGLAGKYTIMESESKAEEVTFDGDTLAFKVNVDFQGTPLVANFKGKIDGDALKGTVDYDLAGQTGTLDVTGKRAKAANPVGVWELLTVTDDGQEIPSSLKITKDGDALAGVYTIMESDNKVEELTLDGDELSFTVNVDFQGTPLVAKIKGKIDGDELKGAVDYDLAGQTGTLDVSGKRAAAADVAGKWNLEVLTDDGQTLESSVVLEKDGSGTFTAADGTEVKLEDPKVDGDQLSFKIKLDFEGTPLEALFKGKVDGGELKGEVDYDLAGQTGTLDFSGKRAE